MTGLEFEDCLLNGESTTVESALNGEVLEVLIEDDEMPNKDGVLDVPNAGVVLRSAFDAGMLKRPLAEPLTSDELVKILDDTVFSFLLADEPFVFVPFVKFAKKSNDEGCVLLNPPKELNTLFFA